MALAWTFFRATNIHVAGMLLYHMLALDGVSLPTELFAPEREVMLPVGEFFDTMYHLSHKSALTRTERLIPELEPYLPTATTPAK